MANRIEQNQACVAVLGLLWFSAAGCVQDNPALIATPSATAEATGPSALEVLAQGNSGTGIDYSLVLLPGEPVCVQLRRTDDVGDFLVCDEDSGTNGDERLRYAVGGLNPEQVPKFVIGITANNVDRVVVDLADGDRPEVATQSASAASDHKFLVLTLDPEPAREIAAIRGLDTAGQTVAGFSFGEAGSEPSPLPAG